jgi:hypothetical protein
MAWQQASGNPAMLIVPGASLAAASVVSFTITRAREIGVGAPSSFTVPGMECIGGRRRREWFVRCLCGPPVDRGRLLNLSALAFRNQGPSILGC